MKKFIPILFLFSILIACKEQKKKLVLPAEKIYFVEVNNAMPDIDDPIWMDRWVPIIGLTEIDKDFNLSATVREHRIGDYYSWNYILGDSIKKEIINAINTHKSDTIYPEICGIYDGPIYLILIEEKPGIFTSLFGGRHNFPKDILSIEQKLSKNSEETFIRNRNKEINQDSIKTYLNHFSKYIPEKYHWFLQ